MADALRQLIEARDTLRIVIADDADLRRAMRSFDRMQAQKIRKPKKEQEEADELAEEVEQLAQEEDFVYATLSGLLAESPAGKSKGEGEGQESAPESSGEPQKDVRRDASDRQEKIADKARELEERLKKLEIASELAKARMAKAGEAAEKASVDLARGSTKDAAETAKSGAGMLHELSRELKGELAREVADELAMARDLAEELAGREAELGEMPDRDGGSQPGNGEHGGTGRGQGKGSASTVTDAERLEQMEEAGRTLEHWLKDASLRATGPSAEQMRDLLGEGEADRVVERMAQIRDHENAGRKPAARREARELSITLERLARRLDVLYRGLVAPELARLIELERRVAALVPRLKELRTDAEVAGWHRQAAELIHELEAAGLSDVAGALTDAIRTAALGRGNGPWRWGLGDDHIWEVPDGYQDALAKITSRLEERIQDMVLKDMVSARDEATPPEFKELVERYYEVLSKRGGTR
jgi:hypothetical protein